MADKLVVAVLGNEKSGKSFTWNKLFGKAVRTGKWERKLKLNNYEWTSVFLVSGSSEERGKYVGDIIGEEKPNIVLCSMQYSKDVRKTIDFFDNSGFEFYVQWLNPGRNDDKKQSEDDQNIFRHLIHIGAVSSVADGRSGNFRPRVNAINHYVYGWAKSRGLVAHKGWN